MVALTSRDLNVISRVGVFAAVRPEAVERLTAPATAVMLSRREALFRQGDPTTSFFIVVDGMLKLYRITCAGEEAVIQILTRGDSVAVASAFAGHRYLVTAEAVSEARVIRISIDHVVRCIREMPDVALAALNATSRHLDLMMDQVEELKAQSGFQRVAEFLASLCSVSSGPCQVTLPYAKVLIAGKLGIKPESLSRAFVKLEAVGVDVRGALVMVRDVAILHELAAAARAPIASTYLRQSSAGLRTRAADFLIRRMAALALDLKTVAQAEPRRLRELRRVCAACACHTQCSADLRRDTANPAWKTYCPNAATLCSLQAAA